MDDLDHSMHIADHDWVSFYEETEECSLLQPVFARPDDWSLSDSEESENSNLATSSGKVEQSPAANANDRESNAAGCRVEDVQIVQGCSGIGPDDLRETVEEGRERQRKSDICSNYPAICEVGVHTRAAKLTNITTTKQTERVTSPPPDGESADLRKEEGGVQTESGTSSIRERDPLSDSQRELNGNEPQITHTPLSSEKERWFVTVNEGSARQRMRVTAGKKKRRPKEPCKNNRMCLWQEKSGGNDLKVEINYESEGWKDINYVTQSGQNSGEHPRSEENPKSHLTGVVSDSTSGPDNNLSEELITAGRNKTDPGSTSHDTLTATSQGLDNGKSDELDFLSVHCCDSDSCPSADESAEEPQQLAKATQQQCSSSLTNYTCQLSLTQSTDDTQDTETHACHNTCSFDVTACDCEGGGHTKVKTTFPSAAKPLNKMPHDRSMCDNDVPSETPGLQKHKINLSASVGSSGDPPHRPPVPEVTLTPCSVADSPETYAIAAGHTRPVYAISAFWDEMEKLTINDILHLRLGGNTEKTPEGDDFPTNPSSLVDTVEYNLPEGGLMDASDAADSDYFTQLDESKPDRSSCDFSTSDFEEDYWQFLGTSRNASPEIGSPCPACEEAESTASEGKETPVPLDDFAGECIEDQASDVFISSNLVWPRRITKSKSVHNVQALNTEDLSSLGHDENSLFLSSSSSLEANMLLKAIDSLATQIPEPFLSNTDTLDERIPAFFPEVSEYFLTQDNTKRDSRSVVLYNPEDISVTPVRDHIFWTYMDEALFSSSLFSSQEKPIPIFSYSHPIIRELTFPNYVFWRVGCEEEEEEEAGISPVRVAPHCLMQDIGCRVTATAPHAFHSWKSLLPIRKISFHDKGSIWCRASGDWVFPIEAQKFTIEGEDPPITALPEGGMRSTLPQFYSSTITLQRRISENIPTASKSECRGVNAIYTS